MMSHSSLAHHYKNNFNLMQHHKYSLYEIENMVPYERDLYIGMLLDLIEEENKKNRK
jgi:hypothetical protein